MHWAGHWCVLEEEHVWHIVHDQPPPSYGVDSLLGVICMMNDQSPKVTWLNLPSTVWLFSCSSGNQLQPEKVRVWLVRIGAVIFWESLATQASLCFVCVLYVFWCCSFKRAARVTVAGYRKNTADLFVFLGGVHEGGDSRLPCLRSWCHTILCFPNHESLPWNNLCVSLLPKSQEPWLVSDQISTGCC